MNHTAVPPAARTGPARIRARLRGWRSEGIRARIPAGIVGVSVGAGSAAHVAAALSAPAGAMAWLMAAMGAACLACASPMAARPVCAGRVAKHLLAMSAAMILIHLVLLLSPGAGGHHGAAGAALPGHAGSMLVLIGVELACLMGASVALRLHRRPERHSKKQP
ncbi:hypothetical protein [Arthrobacter silvisoli]|uniref:hypothetical protein n=1 Tax=Arthrobacter silvisoli TaxID=2291022 RepID=UPI001FEC87D8|nr:hypothetical protein [Arthrobacter silvisoli]